MDRNFPSSTLVIPPTSALSPMATGFPLRVNNVFLPSAEHLYQALKYRLHRTIQETIISQPTPRSESPRVSWRPLGLSQTTASVS